MKTPDDYIEYIPEDNSVAESAAARGFEYRMRRLMSKMMKTKDELDDMNKRMEIILKKVEELKR